MMIRVYRKNEEVFSATGDGNVIEFPFGTRIARVESQGLTMRVHLAETPEAVDKAVLDVTYAERVLVGSGKFIYAIKSYRTRTGVSLRDAKLKMDDLRAQMEREGERY